MHQSNPQTYERKSSGCKNAKYKVYNAIRRVGVFNSPIQQHCTRQKDTDDE